MTTSWRDVQLAIKAGIVSLAATPGGAAAVVWEDEPRPSPKVVLILEPIYFDALQDRDGYEPDDDNPGQFKWALSTLYYVRMQIRAESIYNAPGSDALFTLEKVRAGLRRPDLEWGAGVVNQPDVQTYVHRVSYVKDGRVVSSHSFETGFRCILDYPLDGPVEAAPNMQSVIVEGEAEVGEDDPVEINQTIDRP